MTKLRKSLSPNKNKTNANITPVTIFLIGEDVNQFDLISFLVSGLSTYISPYIYIVQNILHYSGILISRVLKQLYHTKISTLLSRVLINASLIILFWLVRLYYSTNLISRVLRFYGRSDRVWIWDTINIIYISSWCYHRS